MTEPTPRPALVIDGANFSNISGFYAEINRVFMASEDWHLGESLDGFDDLLHGGYGAAKDAPSFRLVWKNMEKSRSDLGREATRNWLLAKLDSPGRFNEPLIRKQLSALDEGGGQTYFDILLEIIAGHPQIDLVAD